MQLGSLDLEGGRYAEAAAALEQVLDRVGDRADVLNALGEAYSRLNDRKRASAALRRSLALDPNQPSVRSAIQKLDNQ
jgi:Flp pilus assembly protein TadD